MTESTQTSKLTHRGGRRPSMLRGDHRFLFAGQYKTTDYNVVDTGVWILYRHHSTLTLRYTGQMAIFHSFLPSPGYTCRKEPAQLSARTIEISIFRKDNVLNFGVLRLMFVSSITCPTLCCLRLRLQMHTAVWGCKHPRLEAVYPQSFQSDVYRHRLPPAPQQWKCEVNVLCPFSDPNVFVCEGCVNTQAINQAL